MDFFVNRDSKLQMYRKRRNNSGAPSTAMDYIHYPQTMQSFTRSTSGSAIVWQTSTISATTLSFHFPPERFDDFSVEHDSLSRPVLSEFRLMCPWLGSGEMEVVQLLRRSRFFDH